MTGIAAVPIGFTLGLLGCLSKPSDRRVCFAIPTTALFLMLAVLIGSQIRFASPGGPPTVEAIGDNH